MTILRFVRSLIAKHGVKETLTGDSHAGDIRPAGNIPLAEDIHLARNVYTADPIFASFGLTMCNFWGDLSVYVGKILYTLGGEVLGHERVMSPQKYDIWKMYLDLCSSD